MNREIERRVQWWGFHDPCEIGPVCGMIFENCESLDACRLEAHEKKLNEEDVWCPRKLIYETAGVFIRNGLGVDDTAFEIGEEVKNMIDEVNECADATLILTKEEMNQMTEDEKNILAEIKYIGSKIESMKVGEVPDGLLKKLRSLTEEALELGLGEYDVVAKLGVITGLEDRVFILKDMPSFREGKIQLRHPSFEE